MNAPVAPTRFQRIRRFVVRRVVFFGLVYLGVIAVFAALETSLVFHPLSAAEGWADPVDPRTQDVWLTDAAGTRLHAWWLPPETPDAGAVLLAHGNGGNVAGRGQIAADLRRATRAGVLLVEYPGYGKSEGKPSEAGCYAAGDAAYRWLTDEAKIPAKRVVLMGESLGGGTAVELATRHDHRALVLVFTFTSLPATAKYHYPWLPTHLMMRSRFDNLSKIGRCTRPVFVAHGTLDPVIPFRQGEQLFAAANEPKEFLRMEETGHYLPSSEEFCGALANFLTRHAP